MQKVAAGFNIHSQTTDKGRQNKINNTDPDMNDEFDEEVIRKEGRMVHWIQNIGRPFFLGVVKNF